jgi:hypothetical protein
MSQVVEASVCRNCGAARAGRFCAECGEQRITAHDYSIGHFFEHAIETLTHFDYRSLRALKYLLFRPGFLTREYLDGRRKPYVGPLQLFVIVNVVFALVGGTTFRVPLSERNAAPFAAAKQRMAAGAQATRGLDDVEFAKEFDRSMATNAKSWIFMMIPVFAAGLAVVYGFRRYFFEHLIFATHLYAFLLVWIVVAAVILALGVYVATGTSIARAGANTVVSIAILAGLLAYLFTALRRVYGDGPVAAALRSLALGALWLPTLAGYRQLLFVITLKLMH